MGAGPIDTRTAAAVDSKVAAVDLVVLKESLNETVTAAEGVAEEEGENVEVGNYAFGFV